MHSQFPVLGYCDGPAVANLSGSLMVEGLEKQRVTTSIVLLAEDLSIGTF